MAARFQRADFRHVENVPPQCSSRETLFPVALKRDTTSARPPVIGILTLASTSRCLSPVSASSSSKVARLGLIICRTNRPWLLTWMVTGLVKLIKVRPLLSQPSDTVSSCQPPQVSHSSLLAASTRPDSLAGALVLFQAPIKLAQAGVSPRAESQ